MTTKTVEELAKDIAIVAYPDTRDLVEKRAKLVLEHRDAQIRSKAIEIINNAISDNVERRLAKDMLNDLL